MKIGIDFDNTIVCYDAVFYAAALEKELIPPNIDASKGAIRDYLRSIGKEPSWTELQGYIYGARMDLAKPFPGVNHFLNLCLNKQIPTWIISHKTLTPFRGPKYDLHKAAKDWIKTQSFPWIPPSFFELTLQSKLARIHQQGCTLFIDDLPELFAEPAFPKNVQKILFDPHCIHSHIKECIRLCSWKEISDFVCNNGT